MGAYEFCRLFIDRASTEEVSTLLSTLLGGAFKGRDLAAPPFDVTVEPNPDRTEAPTDDFITWPVTVEVETAPDTAPTVVVETLTRILQALRSRGARVVAACDYEDELPQAWTSRPENAASDLINAARQLVRTTNGQGSRPLDEVMREYVERMTFASASDVLHMLRSSLEDDWSALPPWARNLAYRLACLQRPDDALLLREAAADLLAFGPDWDAHAESLKKQAEEL